MVIIKYKLSESQQKRFDRDAEDNGSKIIDYGKYRDHYYKDIILTMILFLEGIVVGALIILARMGVI